MNININTDKLKEEIEKFRLLNKNLKERYSSVVKENEDLKEYYDSKTSKKLNDQFANFKTELLAFIDRNDTYINYLQRVVNEGYVEFEEKENELIDKNINVDWSL